MDTAYILVAPLLRAVNFGVFLVAGAASAAIGVMLSRGTIGWDAHRDGQTVAWAVIGATLVFEAWHQHKATQEPKAEPPKRGFEVITKDKP